jgi:hypothetical protein
MAKKESIPVSEEAEAMVSVVFKHTYVGTLGIFYKKNQYRIPQKIADLLKDDIEPRETSEA